MFKKFTDMTLVDWGLALLALLAIVIVVGLPIALVVTTRQASATLTLQAKTLQEYRDRTSMLEDEIVVLKQDNKDLKERLTAARDLLALGTTETVPVTGTAPASESTPTP